MAAMGRAARGWARSQPCALALAAAVAVCAFYYLGGGGETFSSATRRLRATPPAPAHRHPLRGAGEPAAAGGRDLHLLLMFTKAERSPALRAKGQASLRSLLRHGRLPAGDALHLHLVTEGASRDIGLGLLRDLLRGAAFRHQVIVHDVNELTEKLFPIVEAMQKHFSAGSGTYYSDSIFFLSVAMHRIMPKAPQILLQDPHPRSWSSSGRGWREGLSQARRAALLWLLLRGPIAKSPGLVQDLQKIQSCSTAQRLLETQTPSDERISNGKATFLCLSVAAHAWLLLSRRWLWGLKTEQLPPALSRPGVANSLSQAQQGDGVRNYGGVKAGAWTWPQKHQPAAKPCP
ncbi:xyloside xylosyltransferase 1 isoform X2 [Strix aluco]|uniref:xyloside xylosyltransferase 1 isoform X2 n=1 Tax=Strix aluco TaxID=111821 RepID=UPI003DA5A8F1